MKKVEVICYDQIRETLYENDSVLLNFPIKKSLKIIPFFKKNIKKKEVLDLKHEINLIGNFELRTYDFLGKIILVSYYLIKKNSKLLIINSAGLTNDSIVFLLNVLINLSSEYDLKIKIVKDVPGKINDEEIR